MLMINGNLEIQFPFDKLLSGYVSSH